MTVSTRGKRRYWYAADLTHFATALGIRSASALRKDELERAIKAWEMLKRMDVPKTYAAWVRARSRHTTAGAAPEP